jgi:N6-L-threonylcarbamoyladenine synthase
MRVLGIESSCDETGLALYDTAEGILGEVLFSQIGIHAPYGGVVPELASRDHVRRLPLLLRELQQQTGVERPDAIAVTAGPGLMGALLVGVSFARALGFAWGVPVLPVHHLEGHLLAPLLDGAAPFPAVALLVSGGHTLLMEVRRLGDYVLLGETLDDAAGEAFDKAAKMMGLAYPGGPILAQWAERGDPAAFALPRPLLDRPGLDFSFSGLKTAFRYALDKIRPASDQQLADLAASFQAAVVETLAEKCRRALQQTGHRRLIVAGGVGANKALRARLADLASGTRSLGPVAVHYPRLSHCTDNGAMIALVGGLRLAAGLVPVADFPVRARWPMESLEARR